MGDTIAKHDSTPQDYGNPFLKNKEQFMGEPADNGLCLSGIYVPVEILLHILSYVDAKEILKCSLVCREWNNLIKSHTLWATIYKRKYNRKAKQLPWYVYYCLFSTNYFDTNLLKNGNGQDKFNNWEIKANGGDRWIVEDPPAGADALPLDVPEFNHKTSCFATSYQTCYKVQQIKLGQNKLLRYILDCYKPHIYLSEWASGRFDCGCVYRLGCGFIGKYLPESAASKPWAEYRVQQWEGREWKKIELIIQEYPEGVEGLTFEHEGCDTQFWAGHYGSKMAGGVIKILFDTIEELPIDKDDNEIPKKFNEMRFTTNATISEDRSVPHRYLEYAGSQRRRRVRCRRLPVNNDS